MQALFSYDFRKKAPKNLLPITSRLDDIDKTIVSIAPEWPIDKISKIDLAILRLSVYELTIEKEAPPKVIIDEAVELGKAYGNDSSPKFINGALGALIK